ncbi:sialidase family protein [Amycolatopsis sp. H20-H5]|uniref:sialidase family protein n=1 Tax=Amycolatopsis sp. H20-H5 TaxID=3046309 RepID=UPI002DB6C9BA|nr:hypothetical protein [Amycolatopsis sp. H20-H5]MEC3978472.1 hypothetical protein [Amycolatopsis sp. H20-H5]
MKPIRWAALAAAVFVVLALSAPPAGAATVVPKGFAPASTSWLGPQRGFVLGYAPCGKGAQCPALLATGDGGGSWTRLGAPPVSLPASHNHVKLTMVDERVALVSDGVHVLATSDAGRHWSPIALAGAREPFYISKIAQTGGRVFALLTTYGKGAGSTRLYAGAARSPVLTPVPGFVATGGLTYGDLATEGGLQVALGSDYAGEKYWTSRDGLTFSRASAPCPAASTASLVGVRQGEVLALCSGSAGSPQPGSSVRQLWHAPRLGGRFTGTSQAPVLGITQSFSAASALSATIAAEGGGAGFLHSTVDGGRSWTSTLLSERGLGLFDLDFPAERVGVVVDGMPGAADGSAVYRTIDGGITWSELTFD